MPVIQGENPWASIIGSLVGGAGQFMAAKQQAKTAKQEHDEKVQQQGVLNANAQMQLGQGQQRIDQTNQNQAAQQAAAAQKAATEAKSQAASEVHQQAVDALAEAKQKEQATKDHQQFMIEQEKIISAHRDAQAKIKSATDVASIHAAAAIGSAQIHAASAVQSAGIHAGVEARGQDLSHQDRVRGQDLQFKAKNAPKPPKPTTALSREQDHQFALEALKAGRPRDEITRAYAAKWGITPSEAGALFP